MTRPTETEILGYLLTHGRSTSSEIASGLGLPEASVSAWRALESMAHEDRVRWDYDTRSGVFVWVTVEGAAK